jgi:CMD domain protein
MSHLPLDVIDHLTGITPGSRLDLVRSARPEARTHSQKSFAALFSPADPGSLSILDRHALAAFVAGLHQDSTTSDFYATRLASLGADSGIGEIIAAEITRGLARGPYGDFPAGPLTAENVSGPHHRVDPDNKRRLGEPLSAALEHAHLLVFHPRDASAAALQSLLDSGLTANAVVTVSQLVAFLTFQIRVVAGLRAFAA